LGAFSERVASSRLSKTVAGLKKGGLSEEAVKRIEVIGKMVEKEASIDISNS
jgi:hypothetical protein